MHGTIETFLAMLLSSGWAYYIRGTEKLYYGTMYFQRKQANNCVFPTWQQPSCEEVEDGKCAGSQSNEGRPVHSLVVLDHVDAAQPLPQSVGLHDCQALSLLAPPAPLRRFLIQPQVLSLISSQIPPRSLARDVCGLRTPCLCNASCFRITMCTAHLTSCSCHQDKRN